MGILKVSCDMETPTLRLVAHTTFVRIGNFLACVVRGMWYNYERKALIIIKVVFALMAT